MSSQTEKVFYKMRLWPDINCSTVYTTKFIAIRETDCVHFCLVEDDYSLYRLFKLKDESVWDFAKRRGLKTYRIYKNGSRIAFDSRQKAWAHLRFLKHRHLLHLERDTAAIKRFLSASSNLVAPDKDVLNISHTDILRDTMVNV